MPVYHRKPRWAVPEAQATPEEVFLNRRSILQGMGFAGLALATAAATKPARGQDGGLYPASRNDAYRIERDLTPEDISSRYNNFYEFGSHKQIYKAAEALVTDPWDIEIDGMVEEPMTIAFDDLEKKFPLEERLYRHRCVEAWSMTVPWTGFPLAALVDHAKPLSSARYVRFETFHDPAMASGQKQVWYPWPYVEGVTMAEARNDLAFMVTGVYGKPLANQFGAPLRLALPWKYGFKSIKSITKITFTDERPRSFWEQIAANEYGFWANVNPEVPHPRWSQAMERVLGTNEDVPTVIYNGYGGEVAGLYEGLEGEKLFM
ncbi:protein-methionine-sulfoxide reductase catalytic subunit MsrP [Nitratireductor luteus]|uniref:protein-methionine-sulfoxide reductase catalytic subunit MsrP n=1 Tax=Nitratireductor luteus TaxID=2976980 RepID=UPI0022408758|nr:protein-methionine-sulfoxide reductase catalytic subunit MsrP [Nitratireductor luteus]